MLIKSHLVLSGLATTLLFLHAGCNRAPNQNSGASSASSKQQFADSIPNTSFTIEPASVKASKFLVPTGATDATVNGGFNATGNIEVSVLSEDGFNNWRSGQPAKKFYDSQSAARGSMNVSLPGPGTYFVITENKFSPFAISVDAHLNVHYTK